MRRQFDQQLALLNRELIEMGALCEEVIALSSQALTEGDPERVQALRRRQQELRPLLQEARELAEHTAHYYDRGYIRREKYRI